MKGGNIVMSKQTIAIIVLVILVFGLFGAFMMKDTGYSQKELEDAKTDAIEKANLVKQAEIDGLKTELEAAKVIPIPEVTNSESLLGYILDELGLGSFVNDEVITDKQIDKLVDSEVEVDGESYDYEEKLIVDGVKVAINGEDYKENPFLNLFDGSVSYGVTFDNLSKVDWDDEDSILTFKFLGKEVSIIDWSSDGSEVSTFEGEEKTLKEGESVTVGDKTLTLTAVSDDDNVFVTVVDAKTSKSVSKELIEDEDAKTINGLEVKVNLVIFNSVTPKLEAILTVGEEVEKTISNGDEFAEDSAWEYVVSENYFGITLKEDFIEIDEDEDFKAIGVGEVLCLPNDFVCIKYNGFEEEDFESYKFSIDDGFILVKGNFDEDDDGKIYIRLSDGKIFSDDNVDDEDTEELTSVQLGDSDEVLTSIMDVGLLFGVIHFEDIDLTFSDEVTDHFVSLTVDGEDVSDNEDNIRSIYGSIVSATEDNFEDNILEVSVPMNLLENSISFY